MEPHVLPAQAAIPTYASVTLARQANTVRTLSTFACQIHAARTVSVSRHYQTDSHVYALSATLAHAVTSRSTTVKTVRARTKAHVFQPWAATTAPVQQATREPIARCLSISVRRLFVPMVPRVSSRVPVCTNVFVSRDLPAPDVRMLLIIVLVGRAVMVELALIM